MPQTVEMKSSKRNSSEISDNKNKHHISNHNEPPPQQLHPQQQPLQQRNKRSRQQQHIYENLPAMSTSSQQLRKYFRREAIYENLCRGCGYGVFAAQGQYCHFCQCIVSGSVVAALQQNQPSTERPSLRQLSDCNIYENICERCRGIYSDSDQCECARADAPRPSIKDLPLASLPPLATAAAAAATGKAGSKSRTLLGYSKSSAATLTRLFGSLKQLNHSGSLQRRLFYKEAKNNGSSGGSPEIIHNVDEVFRTQAAFDMQRICELKRQGQLHCSRSDQHIYGRLRSDREPTEKSGIDAAEERQALLVRDEEKQQPLKAPVAMKKPRISRMRLLHSASSGDTATSASLYLNESICQWMNALRRELHCYEDANGGVGCQQPKSVPPGHARERAGERDRERERERDQVQEYELVILRRSEKTRTATITEEPAEQHLIDDFKRKLLAQREQQHQQLQLQDPQLESTALLVSDQRQRRCGINERHDAAFVTEFLSGLALSIQSQAHELKPVVKISPAALLASRLPLRQLWESATLAASLHGSVICFFGSFDKLLSAFLHGRSRQRQRQRLRLGSGAKLNSESDNNNNNNNNTNSSESESRRRLLGPPLLELAVVQATPVSDDVAVAWRLSDTVKHSESAIKSECVRECESGLRSEINCCCCSHSKSSKGGVAVNSSSSNSRALMAAPKQSGDTDHRSSCDDSENNNSNNKNNKQCNNVIQQQQHTTQNFVIKVRRPAPQVPVRNPTTSLTKLQIDQQSSSSCSSSNNNTNNKEMEQENDDDNDEEEDEEESIYQTIWQFKTVEPPAPINNNSNSNNNNGNINDEEDDFEIIQATEAGSDDDAEVDVDVDDDDDADADADAEAKAEEAFALQAAAAAASFAAGARHKLTKPSILTPTSTSTATATPATTPLPSPTASMDQGAWETDDEFMFAKIAIADKQQSTLSVGSASNSGSGCGSTVTNSTATLGSLSSNSSSGMDSREPTSKAPLTHPLLRNICILYSLKEPQKYSAIFYEYQRSQMHQRFMTRIRRPAPPPPSPLRASSTVLSTASSTPTSTATSTMFGNAITVMSPSNDDSGCSCEADSEDAMPEHIPQPLKEDWALAVLAAAASSKRGVASRAGRKLRVRSNARLMLPSSVLAWREQLQDVNCCEDEEDMIVPVTDILRAQQIQEDNEVQQTQQTTILQRFKSASIGNLVDLPGEEDKKSIKNRMRMKFAVNSNVFRLNRSPKSEKKSRSRRSQVNSLCLDEQSKYPLFAARLNSLELNMSDHPYVPRFVVDICAHIERPDCIEQDGLYRASGNKLLVDELKRKLSHLYDPRWLQTDDIHTLTSLHKQFFRELPAPLITHEAYERLGRSLTDDAAIERMRLAFDEMPEPNRSTLRFLIKHLTNVATSSSSNRMPASNLAIVWGPCLLAANDISFDIGRMNMLAKVLIENYERIFRPANERLVC